VHGNLGEILNSESMGALRDDIQSANRAECARCVCSMWRAPDSIETLLPA
jgi:hypothetical protein